MLQEMALFQLSSLLQKLHLIRPQAISIFLAQEWVGSTAYVIDPFAIWDFF